MLRFIGEEAYATIDYMDYEMEQDGGYFVATMESRPGLLATGFTKEQLLQDIIECALVWDEAKKEQRNRKEEVVCFGKENQKCMSVSKGHTN